ncbi:hypothetical protein T440DRAFT_547680 [Plenodomus tracheiphilus IPT5]|uniref:Uncharacterized protein n=1 Tax=Plenodomus tracheiphilus IPT5 TaxID=1408161 RepID=A0A6A7BG81_9PLEO|nr:hypothetical protein T440DRAFT_547680 [Plenodomus tracheiphilus IPT5]
MDDQPPLLPQQNSRSVIEDDLPKLKIGLRNEATKTCALRDMFVGELAKWTTFEEEVLSFYNDEVLKAAFHRVRRIPVDLERKKLKAEYRNHAILEHLHVPDEQILQARFFDSAVARVLAVTRTLLDADYSSELELQNVKSLPLPANISAATAKTVPVKKRGIWEPDVVFKIPDEGPDQHARIMGEMKFCGTCQIRKRWGNMQLQTNGSMRHVFGQIARDMRERGVRFGFVSTYVDTVFLKISLNGSKPVLLFSEPIAYTDSVVRIPVTSDPEGMSVRLGLLYLIHRASDDDAWSFNPSLVPKNKWTVAKPRLVRSRKGPVAAPFDSPYILKRREDLLKISSNTTEDQDQGEAAAAVTQIFSGSDSDDVANDFSKLSLDSPPSNEDD